MEAIPPKTRSQILEQLAKIETEENIEILFAIESGSRAWGFPSPDSDYDVRFIYKRRAIDYVRLKPMRDVVERPISDDLDIAGWDIQKALNLLLKPNPVLLEWLQSPIKYIWNEDACAQLMNFSRKITHVPASSYHYLHLGENNWRTNIEDKKNFKLKKYFYVLRPAMALKYIAKNPTGFLPMRFQELMDGVDLPQDLRDVILNLIKEKSNSNESKLSQSIPIIDDFVTHEFAQAHKRLKDQRKPQEKHKEEANNLFQSFIFPN